MAIYGDKDIDRISRELGIIDNLRKWGDTALTGRDISSDLAKLDVALSTRATETTLALVKDRLAFLEFDDNFVKPNWDDDNADGVIYSPVATSGAIDTYSDVWSKIFPPSELAGTLEKMARGETASFSTLNATTTLTWQWQIRPKDGTWIDLHPAVTESPAAITTVERTRQGEKIPSGLTTTPFEIRLQFKTSEANQGQAKVKASSYVKFRLHAT